MGDAKLFGEAVELFNVLGDGPFGSAPLEEETRFSAGRSGLGIADEGDLIKLDWFLIRGVAETGEFKDEFSEVCLFLLPLSIVSLGGRGLRVASGLFSVCIDGGAREALRLNTEARKEAGLVLLASSDAFNLVVVGATCNPVLVQGRGRGVERRRSSIGISISSEISFNAQFSRGSKPFRDRIVVQCDLIYFNTPDLASSTNTRASIGKPSSQIGRAHV